MRAKTEWKVPIQMLQASASPTIWPMRPFISRAALLVKVRAVEGRPPGP